MKLTTDASISELKDLIKGSDFTAISTRELATIGSKLFELGLVDRDVACNFISGHMAFDKDGYQTDRDGKYNAIAMFNEMMEDNKAYARKWPVYAHQESFKFVTRGLLATNHAINALSYFVFASGHDLRISLEA